MTVCCHHSNHLEFKRMKPEKCSPLTNIHPWKLFIPENYSPLKIFPPDNIHIWKIFTPEKYSPQKIFTPKNIQPRKYSPQKKYFSWDLNWGWYVKLLFFCVAGKIYDIEPCIYISWDFFWNIKVTFEPCTKSAKIWK